MATVVTLTDVTPGTTGSWQDVDITSYVGSDAGSVACAHLRILNNSGGGAEVGVRKNGSTDDQRDNTANGSWFDVDIGVDSSDIFEVWVGASGVTYWLWAYSTTAEAESLTDGYNFDSVLTANSYTNVDVSGQFTGTCEIACGTVQDDGFNAGDESFRPDGSTDDPDSLNGGDGPVGNGSLAWKAFAIPCVSEIFECNSSHPTGRDHLVNVALTSGVTKAANYTSITGTHDDGGGAKNGTFQEVDLTGNGVTAGDALVVYTLYSEIGATVGLGIRPAAETLAHTMETQQSRQIWGICPMSSGDLIDLYLYASANANNPYAAIGVYGSIAATPSGGVYISRHFMSMGMGR